MYKLMYSILVVGLFFSCAKEKKAKKPLPVATMEKVEYVYNDVDKNLTVTITQPPQRAAVFSPHMTEMLLALGLEGRMILGTTEEDVLPEFRQAYKKVPNKEIGHSCRMTKEAFLLLEADFVSGDGDIKPETTGSAEDLIKMGVAPFLPKSVSRQNATLEDVYQDFQLLGKIFNVNKKADELVNSMKTTLEIAQKTFKNKPDNEKPKVMVMSSFNNGIWIFSSLATDLINKANGKHVFSDVDNTYELVSYESVVHRNPDIIFIANIQSRGMSVKEKSDYLKNHPILKSVNAVKNNKIYQISFGDVSPGIRNVDFIIKMNKLFYQ